MTDIKTDSASTPEIDASSKDAQETSVLTTDAQVKIITNASFNQQVSLLVEYVCQFVGEAYSSEPGSNPDSSDASGSSQSARRILLLAPSSDACSTLRQALGQALNIQPGQSLESGLLSRGVTVATPFEVARTIMEDPYFAPFANGRTRILEPQDVNMLIEDVKTCGIRTGKLRAMLRFFDRTLYGLADNGLWFKSQDDLDTYNLMIQRLTMIGGILPSQVCNLVWRFLDQGGNAASTWAYQHVLVCDFQDLSRSSQALACRLAQTDLVVFSDPDTSSPVAEPFPNADGQEELATNNPGTDFVPLCVAATHGAAGTHGAAAGLNDECCGQTFAREIGTLRQEAQSEGRSPFLDTQFPHDVVESALFDYAAPAIEADFSADTNPEFSAATSPDASAATNPAADTVSVSSAEGIKIFACPNEASEIANAVRRISDWVDSGVSPDEIRVVSPHPLWTANLSKQLARQGIPVARRAAVPTLNSDIRDFETCASARIHTLLQLVADPQDQVAWRTWIGYGDWLANSEELLVMIEKAQQNASPASQITLVDLLEKAAAEQNHGNAAEAYALGKQALGEIAERFAPYSTEAGSDVQAAPVSGLAILRQAAFAVTGSEEIPSDLARLYSAKENGRLDEDMSVQEMLANAQQKAFTPGFLTEGVRISSASHTYGFSAKRTLWMGFANGFIPSHDYFDNVASSDIQQQREWISDCKKILAVIQATENELVFTFPQVISAQVAQRSGALATRIQLVDHKKVFLQSPSEFAWVLRS